MDPFMPLDNSLVALPWVRLLLALRGANPQNTIDAILRGVHTGLLRSLYNPPRDTCPGFYFGYFPDKQYCLIDGATTLQQATLLTAGYLGRAGDAIRNPQCEYLNDAATFIMTTVRDAGFAGPLDVRIGGYSLGGAIAPIIPIAWHVLTGGDPRGNAITFGAPKVHGFRHNQQIGMNTHTQRYVNDDDPVPLFPPSALDFPQIIGIVGPIHAARLANFSHPGSGTVVARDGRLTAGLVPTVAPLTFGVNLANWLFDIEGLGGNPHALLEYERRFVAMEAANARAVHVPQAHPQRQEEVQRPQMNQQERRVVDAIARRAIEQDRDPVIVPVDKIFKWVRVGRINCVAFGDKLVTITSTKRKAKRLANSGNDFLRVLQRQAVVDPVSMTTQFENYFLLASAINNGFRPVMATVFPAIGN